MPDQHRLDLRRPQALACDLDGVVGAAKHVPEAILWIDVSPVAVHPGVWKAAPVRVEVALAVAPESTRHARPGIADDELADFAAHRAAFCIDDVGGDARHRARER